MLRFVIFCLALLVPFTASADKPERKGPVVEELNWLDRQHLKRQVQSIDDLARIELGSQVHGDLSDLELLQRIVDRGLVKKDERITLQALGAVLGNIMAKEYQLQWMIYEDKLGRSRALCIEGTMHCLFPITMLSRRMEVGLLPRVEDIYNNAVEMIKPYLPKGPYEVEP